MKILALAMMIWLAAGHIYSDVPDDYFPAGKPTYLSSPTKYTGNLALCGLVANVSSVDDSYCNDATLQEIQNIIQWFSGNTTSKMNKTMETLRDSFNTVSNLLWRRMDADRVALNGVKMAIDKVLMDYRTLQLGVGREMLKCMNTMNQMMAGFLCAGCNATRFPQTIRPSTQPVIHLFSSNIAAAEGNCSRMLKYVSTSVELYHRTKQILVDLLTSEMGSQNHLCTCDGAGVNYTDILNFNDTLINRIITENVYSISSSSWNPFLSEISMVASDVTATMATLARDYTDPTFISQTNTFKLFFFIIIIICVSINVIYYFLIKYILIILCYYEYLLIFK